jgi:hypothetical protein
MTNFFSILLLIWQVFCCYGFKEQTLFIIPTFINILLSLQLVLEPTYVLLHTFLQLWQYMLIILTWEFFINFSFSIVPQLFYKFRNEFYVWYFIDFKRVYKVQIYKNHTFNSFVFSYCNRFVCFIRKLI